jgi:hypothetical protein
MQGCHSCAARTLSAARVTLLEVGGSKAAFLMLTAVCAHEVTVPPGRVKLDPKWLLARTGNFFVELTGLRPGVYFYKYIVDGTWTVDPTMPKVNYRAAADPALLLWASQHTEDSKSPAAKPTAGA